jgi:hypothetical protein
MKAEEFLDKHCLWINKRHWESGEKEQKLYQIGAKTLEQYAQQIAIGFGLYLLDEFGAYYTIPEMYKDFLEEVELNHQNQER